MNFAPVNSWILCFLLKRGNVRVNLSTWMSSVLSAAKLLVRLAWHTAEVGSLLYIARYSS